MRAVAAVKLSADDLEVAYYVFSRFINGRLPAGKSIPEAVRPLFKRIELMSVTGHETDGAAEQLGEELIGTAEVAAILSCDPRQVRRLANDLDGCRINGRWVFTKSVVKQYEESGSAHRRSGKSPGRGVPRRAG
jgi:hypothetical protein